MPLSALPSAKPRRATILDAAVGVFGQHGFRKASMDDIALAAGISKQGLYLHFSSKADLLTAAVLHYLDHSLERVEAALANPKRSLHDRLVAALDEWFGVHIVTFGPPAIDIIEIGRKEPNAVVESRKNALRKTLANAIASHCNRPPNVCTPKEIASHLFSFGLTWKDYAPNRVAFRDAVSLCVRVSCQIGKGD